MRGIIISFIAASVALTAGCAVRPYVSLKALTSPPYSGVVEGHKLALSGIPHHIPTLSDGMALAFFVTSTGNVSAVVMDVLETVEVKGAEAVRNIKEKQHGYDVCVPKAMVAVSSSHLDRNVGVEKFVVDIKADRLRRTVTTALSTIDIMGQDSSVDITATEASAGIQSTRDVAYVQVAKADAQRILGQESIKATGIGERASSSIEERTEGATFGFLYDSMSMRVDSSFDIIKVLRDQFILDGFYQNETLIEGDRNYAVSVKEEQLFADLVSRPAPLNELLNRPASARYREVSNVDDVRIAVSAKFVTDRVKHHGEELLLSLQVHNAGSVPAYDLMLLNQLPKHTTFERFPVPSTRASGFLHRFNRDSGMLVFRLYRPLLPGQTFKTTIMLRLDRWDVLARRTFR